MSPKRPSGAGENFHCAARAARYATGEARRAWFIREGMDGEEGLKPEDAADIERIAIKEEGEEL